MTAIIAAREKQIKKFEAFYSSSKDSSKRYGPIKL